MHDLNQIAARVAQKLIARKQTIAVAESSAGGLISAALLAVPGASAYFLGGVINYTQASREGLLSITTDDMHGMRSASEPYARLMARRVREKTGADWALAETGAAGPTGNRYGDKAGHACFAVTGPTEHAKTLETSSADRADNMNAFAIAALECLDQALDP